MQKENYQISVDGCDASTVIYVELSDVEFKFLERIAKIINLKSTSSCMPTMEIVPIVTTKN